MLHPTLHLKQSLLLGLLVGRLIPLGSEGFGAERQMETLDRGCVAIDRGDQTVMISWRLLADDPEQIGFHVDRQDPMGVWHRLTSSPLRTTTHWIDADRTAPFPRIYRVTAVADGRELEPPTVVKVELGQKYLVIPLQTLPGHTPNDASVGDLDGDGRYEIVVKQEMRPRDNSQRGPTGETKLVLRHRIIVG